MRTTLDIDEKLVGEVEKLTGEKGKSKAVNKALAEYVRLEKIDRLIGLMGRVAIEEDWRKLRDGELGEER